MNLNLSDFKTISKRIQPYVKKTTLLRCEALETYLGTPHRIFLKLESEQPTNSFKVRGAFNALLSLSPENKVRGIVTRSLPV
jgi:threonine dehydratase